MAVVPYTTVLRDGGGSKVVKWEGLAAPDTGQPYACVAYSDKSIQFLGTFGGNVLIEGTMDPDKTTAVYATLNDPQGNALSGISSARIENDLEHSGSAGSSAQSPRPSAGVVWPEHRTIREVARSLGCRGAHSGAGSAGRSNGA